MRSDHSLAADVLLFELTFALVLVVSVASLFFFFVSRLLEEHTEKYVLLLVDPVAYFGRARCASMAGSRLEWSRSDLVDGWQRPVRNGNAAVDGVDSAELVGTVKVAVPAKVRA